MVSIICNSSYVLISIILSVRLSLDESTSPGCPVKYIVLIIYMIWQNIYGCGIIYLSEQPEGECSHLSRWIIISNSRLDHTSEQDGYFLCAKFRIAMIKLAVANNTMNSSYVLIIITSFCQISEKVRARPPAARTNILLYKIYYKYIKHATK